VCSGRALVSTKERRQGFGGSDGATGKRATVSITRVYFGTAALETVARHIGICAKLARERAAIDAANINH
jgi:hypothetical protein